MKTIIAGSRKFINYSFVWAAIYACPWHDEITEVVSGNAKGVDRMGESYAKQHGWPIKKFPAQWGEFGKQAGPIRNQEMAKYADALVLIWDGKSKGSKNMLNQAKSNGLRIFTVTTEEIENE
jgi:hypothetical protein